jgi:SAM-dependent methyltransferase
MKNHCPYDAYYYKHNCGQPYERNPEWLAFFSSIADTIIRKIDPRKVLDVGCAMGMLVEAFRDRGVEAYGLDLSEYAVGQVREDVRSYCRVASLLDPIPDHCDLVIAIEVLEHIEPKWTEKAIGNLATAGKDILFSSTPFDYKEGSHFNTQPPEYWAELFAGHGFFRDVDFDASFITPWAARFLKKQEPISRLIRGYERKFWLLWKENTDLRAGILEADRRLAALGDEVQELKKLDRSALLPTEDTEKRSSRNQRGGENGPQPLSGLRPSYWERLTRKLRPNG